MSEQACKSVNLWMTRDHPINEITHQSNSAGSARTTQSALQAATMHTYSASRKARQCPSSEALSSRIFSRTGNPLASAPRILKSPTARGDKPRPASCTSCPARTSWASAIEKCYIVNLPGAWGYGMPRVSQCACMYGGELAGVTCVRASVRACVRARLRGGWEGLAWCFRV